MKDKLGISLSGLCICHCLLIPALALLGFALPAMENFESEWVHKALLLPIVLVACWSMYSAVKLHGYYKAIYFVLCGLALLLSALVVPHHLEQIVTVLGAVMLSYGHWLNYQYTRHCDGEKI